MVYNQKHQKIESTNSTSTSQEAQVPIPESINVKLPELQEEKLQQLHAGDATQQNENSNKAEKKKVKNYRVRTFKQIVEETKSLPPAKRLMGDLIYENEVTILAGDTGVGKSLSAVEIAIHLAKGTSIHEIFPNESAPLNVVYIDYELTDIQFYKRYHADDYPDNLFRVDGNPECTGIECGVNIKHIKEVINTYNAQVIIIDNLSALINGSGRDPEQALSIMSMFKSLQKELGVTLLVLAHTPKRYENTPLRVEDVAGSKQISNFTDSIWFIAKSTKGKSIRYYKQVKQRNTEELDGVYTMEIKSNENGIYFEYLGLSSEKEHLRENSGDQLLTRNEEMKAQLAEGKTRGQVAQAFGVHKSTLSRAVKK